MVKVVVADTSLECHDLVLRAVTPLNEKILAQKILDVLDTELLSPEMVQCMCVFVFVCVCVCVCVLIISAKWPNFFFFDSERSNLLHNEILYVHTNIYTRDRPLTGLSSVTNTIFGGFFVRKILTHFIT